MLHIYTHGYNFARRTCLFARIKQEVRIAKFSQFILFQTWKAKIIQKLCLDIALKSQVVSKIKNPSEKKVVVKFESKWYIKLHLTSYVTSMITIYNILICKTLWISRIRFWFLSGEYNHNDLLVDKSSAKKGRLAKHLNHVILGRVSVKLADFEFKNQNHPYPGLSFVGVIFTKNDVFTLMLILKRFEILGG